MVRPVIETLKPQGPAIASRSLASAETRRGLKA